MSTAAAKRDMTWEEANEALRKSEERFSRGDVEGILGRYADGVVIRFGDLPEIRGKDAAEHFLRARFARQTNYKVKKELVLVSGQKYANTFTATWIDSASGKTYEARGTEILQLDGGKVMAWDCGYNYWETGKAGVGSYFSF